MQLHQLQTASMAEKNCFDVTKLISQINVSWHHEKQTHSTPQTVLKFGCFRGGTCLDCLWFLSGRKLGQYADQELLKSLFQNKTPDLSLKYILIQVHDQQGQQ